MKKRLLALLLVLTLSLGLAACGTVNLPPVESGTAAQTGATETDHRQETEAPPDTAPAPEPVETETPPEAPTEPSPGSSDSSAHIYPEDPWGLVHSMKLEYTTREGEKRCLEFPYLYTEGYLEEENMYIEYSVLDMDNRLADTASKIARAEASEIYSSKSGFEYKVHAWEDILVIAAKYWDSIEENVYQIYLVDTSDPYLGQLSTADLLERMGISEEYFLETCRQQCLERFHERWDPMASVYGEDYQWALREAEKGEYINLELQAYPDENGRLCVIAPLISVVEAYSYYGILELQIARSN